MTIHRLILLFSLGALGLCSWACWRHRVADRDFERLLTGNNDVALVSLEIEGHGKRIVLNDAGSLGYLSKTFRSAEVAGGKGVPNVSPEFGATYDMKVRLSTGSVIRCGVYIPERKDRLTLHFPIDDFSDGILYLITLKDPIPEPLSQILSQLK